VQRKALLTSVSLGQAGRKTFPPSRSLNADSWPKLITVSFLSGERLLHEADR